MKRSPLHRPTAPACRIGRVLQPVLPVVLLAAVLLSVGGAPAQAQDKTFLRFYYSNWMQGRVQSSPADPDGLLSQEVTLSGDPKAELEVIFLGHLGLSFSRRKLQRSFRDELGVSPGCTAPPCEVSEEAVQQSLNATLYAFEMAHNQFNLFAGGGAGQVDYDLRVDGVKQSRGEVFDNLSLSRWFAGVEYSFERIGFRLEIGSSRAHKELVGQSAEIEERFRYFTVFIPLN